MLNIVALIGRLGADPEIRYTPSGVPVANFRTCPMSPNDLVLFQLMEKFSMPLVSL